MASDLSNLLPSELRDPESDAVFSCLNSPAVLDSLPDGVYVTDRNRRILLWSSGAERLTGWSRDRVIGRTCYDNLLCHVDKDGHPLCGHEHCPLHRAIATGQPTSEPLLVFGRSGSGERMPMEVSAAPLRGPDGVVVGGVEVFRDLTELMQDLDQARRIQMHACALPTPDPRIFFDVRYVPQEVIGGDFYRVEAVDSDCYSIILADVMGHGIAAALYTMQFRLLWEDCRGRLGEPGAFLTELNRRLHPLVRRDRFFATALCLQIDLRQGVLRAASAGHPPALRFRRDGTIERIHARGLALGLLPDAPYAEVNCAFDAGDALLLYTDGATEIPEPGDTELGIEGLERLAVAAGLPRDGNVLTELEERLLKASVRTRLPDDLTLLLVRRTEPSEPGF